MFFIYEHGESCLMIITESTVVCFRSDSLDRAVSRGFIWLLML